MTTGDHSLPYNWLSSELLSLAVQRVRRGEICRELFRSSRVPPAYQIASLGIAKLEGGRDELFRAMLAPFSAEPRDQRWANSSEPPASVCSQSGFFSKAPFERGREGKGGLPLRSRPTSRAQPPSASLLRCLSNEDDAVVPAAALSPAGLSLLASAASSQNKQAGSQAHKSSRSVWDRPARPV